MFQIKKSPWSKREERKVVRKVVLFLVNWFIPGRDFPLSVKLQENFEHKTEIPASTFFNNENSYKRK